MLGSLFITKEKTKDLKLLRDLGIEANKVLKKAGKGYDFLSYAKKSGSGFKINSNISDEQHELLLTIVRNVYRNQLNITKSEISETLSILVNNKLSDFLPDYGFTLKSKTNNKYLIELANAKFYLPRYPWLIFSKRKRQVLEMKNVLTGQKVDFRIYIRGKFTLFELKNQQALLSGEHT